MHDRSRRARLTEKIGSVDAVRIDSHKEEMAMVSRTRCALCSWKQSQFRVCFGMLRALVAQSATAQIRTVPMKLYVLMGILLIGGTAFGQKTEEMTVASAQAETTAQQPPPDSHPNTTVGIGEAGAARTLTKPEKSFAYRQDANGATIEVVDEMENRTLVVRDPAQRPIALYHRFKAMPGWYERHVYDQNGQRVVSSANLGDDQLNAQIAPLGIYPAFPDWLRIDFGAARSLQEIRLISLQDNFSVSPVEPMKAPDLLFSHFGVTDYEFQYWNGAAWLTPPAGFVAGNRKVLSVIALQPAVTTTAIRIQVRHALGYDMSRIVELEAIDTAGINVARLPGAYATASSSYDTGAYAAASAIDGNRMTRWWQDATYGAAPTATTTTIQQSYGGFTVTTIRNSFVTVTKWHQDNPMPTYTPRGYPFQIDRERIEMLGKSFEVGIYKTFNGIEMWDNQGGARVYRYDWASRVKYIADENGDIVSVVRDAAGRPTAVFLGDNGVIEYRYDAAGLLTKRFINLSTGQTLYQVDRSNASRQNKFPTAREVTTAYLPGHGPVAEWDKRFGQAGGHGLFIASLQGQPYALIPMQAVTPSYNNNMPIRRMFTLFEELNDPLLRERVEYNDERIIVHLRTGAESAISAEHISTFSIPRFGTWSDPPPASAFRSSVDKFGGQTTNPEGEGTADNDDGGTSGTFTDSITVISPRPNLPPIIFFFPPAPSGSTPGGQREAPPPDTTIEPPNPDATVDQYPACDPATGEAASKFDRALVHGKNRVSRKPNCMNLFRTLTGTRNQPLNRNDVLARFSGVSLVNGQDCRMGTEDGCDGNAPMWTETSHTSGTIVACPGLWDAAGETMDMGPNAQPGRAALYVLHEILHLLGLPAHDEPGAPSRDAVNDMICNACGPFEGVDPVQCQ